MVHRISIAGRKAIVSGGSSGIGRAIVQAIRAEGGTAIYADRVPPANSDVAGFHQCDLTKPDEVSYFHEECKQSFGVPDILVLNAGRGISQRLDEGDIAQWEYIFQLNVFSALRLLHLFLPEMKKNGFADVVFISSVSSFHPYQTGAVYSATKAALDNISEVLRLENMPGIRVTTIAPGVVRSDFFRNNIDGTSDVDSLEMGFIEPEEIADAVIYAITRRKDIALNHIVIRPTQQEM